VSESLSSRRAAAALAGHTGDVDGATLATTDSEPSVRGLGYGALSRLGQLTHEVALAGLADSDTKVVRRVIECIARQTPEAGALDTALVELLLSGPDVVAETAAWALGERHQPTDDQPTDDQPTDDEQEAASAPAGIVSALITATTHHEDALVRESAAAALGAIGDPLGLPAILIATQDKATVRRRAVLALAAFDGPEVHAALIRAREDRDWQVRQAAEDLLAGSSGD
jgi:HEAT repeat protein